MTESVVACVIVVSICASIIVCHVTDRMYDHREIMAGKREPANGNSESAGE